MNSFSVRKSIIWAFSGFFFATLGTFVIMLLFGYDSDDFTSGMIIAPLLFGLGSAVSTFFGVHEFSRRQSFKKAFYFNLFIFVSPLIFARLVYGSPHGEEAMGLYLMGVFLLVGLICSLVVISPVRYFASRYNDFF